MKKKKKSFNIAIIRVLFDLEKIIISNKVSTLTTQGRRRVVLCHELYTYSNEECSVTTKSTTAVYSLTIN